MSCQHELITGTIPKKRDIMQNRKTYYQIILDKSGSMSSCLDATINGFNEQLQLIKSMKEKYPEQEFYMSLTTFNHEVSHVMQFQDPFKAKPLCARSYQPNGTTALHDAIGLSVMNLRAAVREEVDNNMASVVVVVLTDGYENASKTYNQPMIQKLIKELDGHDNWTFSYLGATPDAVNIASQLNFDKSNAMAYDVAESAEAWKKLKTASASYSARKQRGVVSKKFIR